MTCIVWDGRKLAADSNGLDRGSIVVNRCKIRQIKDRVFAGFAGHWPAIEKAVAWLKVNDWNDPLLEKPDGCKDCVGIMVDWSGSYTKVYYIDENITVVGVNSEQFLAHGSGTDAALAALHAGAADAIQAIEIAKIVRSDVSGPVDWISQSTSRVGIGREEKDK